MLKIFKPVMQISGGSP